MKIVLHVVPLTAFVSFAVASEQPLVQCAVPVPVKFIVAPEQTQAEFNAQLRPGQKHWSAYDCKINVAAMHEDYVPEVRQLSSSNTNNNSSNSSDDDNETTITTTSTTSTTTSTTATNKTNVTNQTALKKTVDAEMGGACGWKPWSAGLIGLGLSFSLPVVAAAPGHFMAPSHPKRMATQIDLVEVLMPCSSLLDPLKDLDGDGALDCKMTQEQLEVSVSVPEVEGTWNILYAQSVTSGSSQSKPHLNRLTIGGGAWCVDSSDTARWEDLFSTLTREQLPLALTNVERFTNLGKPCGDEQACEATMWSFDLAYPASSCTPEVLPWVQPCTAKLLPDGTLVLVRGAPVQASSAVHRPPLMVSVSQASDADVFANGLAVATDSSFEVFLLHKHQKVESSKNSNIDMDNIAEVRQLSSVSNSSDDGNETTTTSTTTSTMASGSSNDDNETTTTSTIASSTTTATNQTDLNKTVNAELGHAANLRVGGLALFCLTLPLLIH